MTVPDLLESLRSDLGLPTSTSDLVSSKSVRKSASTRARSKPNVGSEWSHFGSNLAQETGREIIWEITIDSPAGRRSLGPGTLMDEMRGVEASKISVKMDQGWLLERARPLNMAPAMTQSQGSQLEDLVRDAIENGEEQVQGVRTPERSTFSPSLPDRSITDRPSRTPYRTSPSPSNRLSGLFHGWLDSNNHPAPPPTLQLSTVNGVARLRSNSDFLNDAPPAVIKVVEQIERRRRDGRTMSISGPVDDIFPRRRADVKGLKGSLTSMRNPVEGDEEAFVDEAEWERFLVGSHDPM